MPATSASFARASSANCLVELFQLWMTEMNDSIEQRLAAIENGLTEIKLRNQRVTEEKAWEVSRVRRGLVAALTFIFAGAVLWGVGASQPLLNALIPTTGYVVSTFSIPWVKRLWLQGTK